MLQDWAGCDELHAFSLQQWETPRRALFPEVRAEQSPVCSQPSPGGYTYDFEELWQEFFEDPQPLSSMGPYVSPEKLVLTPAGLVSEAIRYGSPELNFGPLGHAVRRRKLSQKTFNPGPIIKELQENPGFVLTTKYHWKDRRRGHDAFHKFYTLKTGRSWRDVANEVIKLWTIASEADQDRWAFIGHLWSILFENTTKHQLKNRIPLPDGTVYNDELHSAKNSANDATIKCFGVLLTYHTHFGIAPKHTLDERSKLSDEELTTLFQKSPEYQDFFSSFRDHISNLAECHKFKNWAVCMERCMNSPERCRIHLHAFLGQQVGFNNWVTKTEKASIPRHHFIFNSDQPNVSLMRCRGWNGMNAATSTGLYYCCAPKIGQVFSWATAKPFEDCCVLLQRSVCDRPVLFNPFRFCSLVRRL